MEWEMSFANKVAIITGASSGIGWALGRQLAGEGAKVGLLLGPVDLLVANAGLGKPTYLDQSNVDEVEEMFRVNVLGMVYAFEAVLPEMVQRRQGHLAGVSSLASYKGLPGESGYCASKAAVSCYLEGLRIQLRRYQIAVTTICPGFVTTPMTEQHEFKMPFVMDAGEAARRIARALRRRNKGFNFPWQTALLIRLTRWLPDRVMARRLKHYIKEPPAKPAEAEIADQMSQLKGT
jgi:short-subunit dehydrogenase